MRRKSLKINAILNMAKQLCVILFPLITVPYASRILQTVNYGKYNFAQSIVSYFLLIAGLGVVNYAIREGASIREDKKKFHKFANEIFTINLISTIVSYLILFTLIIYSNLLKEYRLLIIVQAISILLTTIGADWINSIYEDYLYLTIRYLAMQTISIICLFLFIKTSEDYIKYSIVTLIATYGGSLLNIFYIRKYTHLRLVWNKHLIIHLKPIIFLFFNTIAVTIYVNSDITILGLIKNERDVGIYSLSTKIYILIKQILNSLIVVTLPRLSALLGQHNINAYQKLSTKIMDALGTIIFPTVICLFFMSKLTIQLVGGIEYIDGNKALKILSISLFFAVLACFYCCAIILPFKQEKICLIASTISAIINIGLNLIFIPLWSYDGAAFTTLLAEIIEFIIFFKISSNFSRVRFSKRVLYSVCIGCIFIGIICVFVPKNIQGIYHRIFITISLSMIVYFLVQILMKNYIIIDILKNVINQFKNRLFKKNYY